MTKHDSRQHGII